MAAAGTTKARTRTRPGTGPAKTTGPVTGARSGPGAKAGAKAMTPALKLTNSLIEFLDSDKGMSPEQRRSGILGRCNRAMKANAD